MPTTASTPVTVAGLLQMTQPQLDALFSSSTVGDIPNGEAKGTAIISPGTECAPHVAKFINVFAWQGKVFDAAQGELRNKILPISIKAIVAKVYKDKSWFDGQDCIALDYSETSVVAHWIRDEIRLVAPNVYLGVVYWDKTRLINFALKFPTTN